MVRIGILGSVGSGKTFIANIFKELSFNIFSADNEVANIYKNNKIVNKKIAKFFKLKLYKGKINKQDLRDSLKKNPKKFKKVICLIKWTARYKVFADVQILINVTSLGMLGQKDLKFDFSIFDKKINVVDIVYNPENTRFLKDARINGHKTFTGLDMFIYQAQKAFYIWNRKNPKITKDIYKKLRKKING